MERARERHRAILTKGSWWQGVAGEQSYKDAQCARDARCTLDDACALPCARGGRERTRFELKKWSS